MKLLLNKNCENLVREDIDERLYAKNIEFSTEKRHRRADKRETHTIFHTNFLLLFYNTINKFDFADTQHSKEQ